MQTLPKRFPSRRSLSSQESTRREEESNGTQKLIEGSLAKGSRVVIRDDVFTQGTSAARVTEAVKEFGCEVVAVLALVDRLRGAKELFRSMGITNYQAIDTIREFGVGVELRSEV